MKLESQLLIQMRLRNVLHARLYFHVPCSYAMPGYIARPCDHRLGRLYPAIVKTAVADRWFPYSTFDHAPHMATMNETGCVMCLTDASA